MSDKPEVTSEDSARAVMALAKLNPEAATGIAKLVGLLAEGDKRAIEIIEKYQRQEITVGQALELVDEYLGKSN